MLADAFDVGNVPLDNYLVFYYDATTNSKIIGL